MSPEERVMGLVTYDEYRRPRFCPSPDAIVAAIRAAERAVEQVKDEEMDRLEEALIRAFTG